MSRGIILHASSGPTDCWHYGLLRGASYVPYDMFDIGLMQRLSILYDGEGL